MGIHHDNGGYSASVSAYIRLGVCTLQLAKTNGVTFSLAEPSSVSIPKETRAELTIIVDGEQDSKQITLRNGIEVGQRVVEYDEAPF